MKPRSPIYILFLLPLLALCGNAWAQPPAVIQVQDLTGLPDTVYIDSTYTVDFNVVNTQANGVYQGPLAVLYSNQDTVNLPWHFSSGRKQYYHNQHPTTTIHYRFYFL
ncbi:MAG: hypothetical protein M0D57_21530 [Sphingobacteriales bacterium JAD_PAG50586_3]|nr:MAG: hypothetical protein M0D57_21530 [Sphingobacteriales bacterium JAD_PAG50586_3]